MTATFSDLKLLRLAVENVGPFRDGIKVFNFEGELEKDETGKSRGKAPSNMYMLLSKNGRGKTTILETIYTLLSLYESAYDGVNTLSRFDDLSRAQLDFRITITIDDKTQTTLTSIWYGSKDPVLAWTQIEIDEIAEASVWAKIGYEKYQDVIVKSIETNQMGETIIEQIRSNIGRPPTSLFGLSCDLPCVLFFPANRAIFSPENDRSVIQPINWGYRPNYLFEADGPEWNNTIDNIFVWLEWLGDERLSELLDYLNQNIFNNEDKIILNPQRELLSTSVSTATGLHLLEKLSHGERALLQLYVRILCHMTENTVILIDEIEVHLHTQWMNRFFLALKSLIKNVPSLSVIFSTHNREMMKVFDHTSYEKGLIKGGYLIEGGID